MLLDPSIFPLLRSRVLILPLERFPNPIRDVDRDVPCRF